MLTAELDAHARWPNGIVMQGLVKMNYLADVDPWLVHMTFVVAEVRDDFEISRAALMPVVTSGPPALPPNITEGAPFRIAYSEKTVRMRLTDNENGTHVDFDVRRDEMANFLRGTFDKADYDQERAALDAYINEGLDKL